MSTGPPRPVAVRNAAAVELARAPKAAVSDADFVAEPEGPSAPTVGDGDFI